MGAAEADGPTGEAGWAEAGPAANSSAANRDDLIHHLSENQTGGEHCDHRRLVKPGKGERPPLVAQRARPLGPGLGRTAHRPYLSVVTETNTKPDELALIYDGECPVCTAYSCSVGVDEGKGLRRINARDADDELVRQAKKAGLDLDDGMVVVHQGKLYHGADALNIMARLAPDRGFGNRINKLLFGNATLARLSYPLLRAGRNTLLRLLGRKKIRDS
jgi:predicted DCC family thiol-disulfide oxidoreductase YuxK